MPEAENSSLYEPPSQFASQSGDVERKRYGEDFVVGQSFKTAAVTVTESHMVMFTGLTGDFYPLHVDAAYAAQTQFGQRLVHGPLVFSLAVGLVSLAGVIGDAAVAWLGADTVRMHSPVRIGDTLHVVAQVKEQRPTRNPCRGIHVWLYSVFNQRDEMVLSFDHKLLMYMRGPQAA